MIGQLRILQSLALTAALLLVTAGGTASAITYTPIDHPLAHVVVSQ